LNGPAALAPNPKVCMVIEVESDGVLMLGDRGMKATVRCDKTVDRKMNEHVLKLTTVDRIIGVSTSAITHGVPGCKSEAQCSRFRRQAVVNTAVNVAVVYSVLLNYCCLRSLSNCVAQVAIR
jgi:hypothetical protein